MPVVHLSHTLNSLPLQRQRNAVRVGEVQDSWQAFLAGSVTVVHYEAAVHRAENELSTPYLPKRQMAARWQKWQADHSQGWRKAEPVLYIHSK